MSGRGWAGLLRAGSALGLLVVVTAQANAGGFAVREQSPYGQGSSFAGVAAGGALSSMFWNPATMTQMPGIVSETDVVGILPFTSHTPFPGSTVPLPGTKNVGDAALVPAGYTSYQLNPNLWLGVSINAPFGLTESFPDAWAGRNYAGDTLLKTYNVAPSLAYRLSDWISVGAGVQVEYAKASFVRGLAALGQQATFTGTGWGFGATAGVTLTPSPWTTVGLGWRSAIDQKLEGTLVSNVTPLPATTLGSTNTTIKLPDIVSLGIRQRLDPRWTLLGTAEWSNWSRIGTSNLQLFNGSPATLFGTPLAVHFQYRDGWFFSGGAEYIWDERLTLRAGLAYEITPVSDQVRGLIVPDNDRFWASMGATWRVSKFMHFDLAYSHIWVKDAPVTLTAASGNPNFISAPVPINYVGTVNGHADIISAALVVRFDELEPTARRPFLKY